MRRTVAVIVFLFAPLLSGCTFSDALFGLFGDHYTGGGHTLEEKRYDYNRQLDAARGDTSWRP